MTLGVIVREILVFKTFILKQMGKQVCTVSKAGELKFWHKNVFPAFHNLVQSNARENMKITFLCSHCILMLHNFWKGRGFAFVNGN